MMTLEHKGEPLRSCKSCVRSTLMPITSFGRSLKSAAEKLVDAVGLILAVTILYAILTMAAIGAGFVIVVQWLLETRWPTDGNIGG